MIPDVPRLFVFDWDGTLIDSVARIIACLRLAAMDLDLDDLGDSRFGDVIGLGLPQVVTSLYPHLDAVRAERYRERYAAHFAAAAGQPSLPFPGALDVLRELRSRGCRLAVATGKSRRGLDRVLAELELAGFFDATRCADETASKPDPRMLHQILTELNERACDAVMIGDTEYDMEMAKRAGMPRIGVSYGVHSIERLADHAPERIIGTLSELLIWPAPERPIRQEKW